jgi:hypothetical protein
VNGEGLKVHSKSRRVRERELYQELIRTQFLYLSWDGRQALKNALDEEEVGALARSLRCEPGQINW